MIDADLIADLRRTFAAALQHDDPLKARKELLAAGWLEALDADAPIAATVVFRIQGDTLHDAAALDDVIAYYLGEAWSAAPGDIAIAYPLASSAMGAATHGVLGGHRHARQILWLGDLSGGSLQLIELDEELDGRPLQGVDPNYGLIGLSQPPSGTARKLAGSDVQPSWDQALAAGRIAVAHQMTAGARAVLGMAVAYAKARKQFGTPIGSFQAVKHRLAETLVAVSAADAATVAAATSQTTVGAALAKVLAGRAAAAAARNCLQVFGGVGFTAEHDFHHYFRRNLVLNRLLGDPRTIERQLGQDLRAGTLNGERIVDLENQLRIDLLEPPLTGPST